MKKINERLMTRTFIQNVLSNEYRQEKRHNRLNENMMSIGGIGFHGGNVGNGFKMQPKVQVQDWNSFNKNQFANQESWEDESIDEDHESWEESSLGEHNYYDESCEECDDDSYAGLKPGAHIDTSGMYSSESDYADEEGAAMDEPETDAYGNLTPQSLYQHFDLDGDGVVDMGEYAEHVDFHSRHPEILEPWLQMRKQQKGKCNDYNSYCVIGDSLINDYDEVLDMLNGLMDKTGASCPSSTAKALSDVIQMLQNVGLL